MVATSHQLFAYRAQLAVPEIQVLLMSRFPARASLSEVDVELFPLPLQANALASKLNAIVG
jgi:hypothetical protein